VTRVQLDKNFYNLKERRKRSNNSRGGGGLGEASGAGGATWR